MRLSWSRPDTGELRRLDEIIKLGRCDTPDKRSVQLRLPAPGRYRVDYSLVIKGAVRPSVEKQFLGSSELFDYSSDKQNHSIRINPSRVESSRAIQKAQD